MRATLLSALTFSLLLGSSAFAKPTPNVTVTKDGEVVGRILLEESAESVHEAIGVVSQDDSSPSIIDQTITTEGSCQSIFRRTKGLWNPLEMKTRLCPTASGWSEKLVQSDDFNAYHSEWRISSVNGSTTVELRVRSDVNLNVPSGLLNQGTANGIKHAIGQLLEVLGKNKDQ